MNYLGASIVIFGFLYLCRLLKLVSNSKLVLETVSNGTELLRDTSLPDSEKEHAMQVLSKKLLLLFLKILLSSLAATTKTIGYGGC